MTVRRWLQLATCVLMLAFGTRVWAHHSFAMFAMDKEVRYEGVITEWKWANPHVHLTLLVKPGPGIDDATVGTWDVEGASTNIMGRQGWTRASYKAGDALTIVGHPMKDGSKGVSLFYVIRPDGTRMYQDIARPKGEGSQ